MQRARDLIKQKLGGGPPVQAMATAFDPELTMAGLTLAGFHVEAGNRDFANFARAMLDDMGEQVRPYLGQWYAAVLHQPGFDTTGMTPLDQIHNEPLPPEDPHDLDAPQEGDTVKTEEAVTNPDNTELTESVYEPYAPQRVNVPGAKEHPGALVQSAAMASVQPPMPSYQPKFPKGLVENGLLSNAQLEAVIYAGEAHQQMVPASGTMPERRRGFFIGDGTGVGKGREIAGIILDNMQQGRGKAVWISKNKSLIQDAKRDWQGLGQNPEHIFDHGKIKAGDSIPASKGILYTTYDTVKSAEQGGTTGQWKQGTAVQFNPSPTDPNAVESATIVSGPTRGKDPKYTIQTASRGIIKDVPQGQLWEPGGSPAFPGPKIVKGLAGQSRIQQMVNWLGKDFDGVIAFDEAHAMGNATPIKGKRGTTDPSLRALAGMDLQKALPNARIVYVSATGATELNNLAYADRLGLWGKGTAFANQANFLTEMGRGGIAAMELVARDMKALGHYIARNLSYDGVEYDRIEHPLTDNQRAAYDKIAEGWQVVLQNFNAALELTSGDKIDSKRRSAVLSQFWGGHQRFFNQIITSMQMPSVITGVERDLAEGRQAVLQLVNTNEAAQKRSLEGVTDEADLEDLDMTPLSQLMQLVEKGYPVQQYEDYMDESGNIRSRPVKDAEDRPVLNKEAVAARDRLLDELGSLRNVIPDGPLEILLNHFGVDNVAEVTGRRERVVRKPDESGEMRTMVEKRPPSANVAEAQSFQSGQKKVLVFSDAGGTGASYHDARDANRLEAGSNARRSHYLVQAGWRADGAVQGFGRTHRTNQFTAPFFHLVTTDLQGQKRFISSIARRLAQLGALTKGERRTGDQGMFGLRDNLESPEATAALSQFYRDVHQGNVPGITMEQMEKGMGLKLVDETTGGLNQNLPPMQQFLNRLLSLKYDQQNAMFNAFSQRLDDMIDAAASDGTLDTGVETYKADRIAKRGDQVVYTDPASGAETRHVHLEVSDRNRPTTWEQIGQGIRTGGRPPLFFVQSNRSGRMFAVTEATAQTDRNGNVVPRYRLTGPNNYDFLPREAVDYDDNDRFTRIEDHAKAQPLWDKEVASTPEFRTSDLHVITGAVLPIWDRLPGAPKVFRLQTVDGERMLGRVIPAKLVDETLRRLGAEGIKVEATPQQIADRVLQGGDVAELANGWTIQRARVAGDWRLELKGPDFQYLDQLRRDGVFTERIGYQTRFFIPTGDAAAGVIGAITARNPLTHIGGPRGGADLLLTQPGGGGGQGGQGGQGGGQTLGREEPEPEEGVQPARAATTAATGVGYRGKGSQSLATVTPVRLRGARYVADYIQKIASPTSRVGAQPIEYIVRHWGAEAARLEAQAEHALRDFIDQLNRLPVPEQLESAHRFETGQPQGRADLQIIANAFRQATDQRTALIQSLGAGYLQRAREDYMGHIWANHEQWKANLPPPTPAEMAAEAAYRMGRRPVQGPATFLKRRYFETQREGIAAGLIPFSTNWGVTQLIKLREMDRFYTGTHMVNEIKRRAGIWVPRERFAEAARLGLVELDDKAFHPLLPPALAHHFTAFDPSLRDGINNLANALGIKVRTPLMDPTLKGLGPDAAGYRKGRVGKKPPEIVARFGGDEAVLMHEIGHELDKRFGLERLFRTDPVAWQELADLGKLRMPATTDPAMIAYLTAGPERIANLFHAWWHAPHLLDSIAPTARDMLVDFLGNHPALQHLVDQVKPSVQLQSKTVDEFFPGLRDVGAWFAPERAAAIFNNYVSRRDYLGHEVVAGFRVASNAATALQLGLSGFHFTFETLDSVSSALALAVEQASQGQVGQAGRSLVRVPVAPIQTFMRGRQLRNAYRNPAGASPEMLRILDAYLQGGGRYSMDTFYRTSGSGTLIRGWKHLAQMLIHPMDLPREMMEMFRRQAGWSKGMVPFQIAGRVFDTIAHPLMGWYVPTMKAGVAYNMIHDWLQANPAATADEISREMTDVIDRTDDRMGEMIHDNTFWKRGWKDMAHLTFRAFGWTLGSVRTLVGAFTDIPKIGYQSSKGGFGYYGLSRRTSYLIGMLAVHTLAAAIITYLNTGKPPQELKDYVYPPDGKGGRYTLPTYVKELFGFKRDPLQWFANKLSPILSYASEVINNRDYFGNPIEGPHDTPVMAQLKHLWNIAKPFTIRSVQQMERKGASVGAKVGAFFGIQPAPGYITNPERQEHWERQHMIQMLKQRERMRARGQID